MVSLFGDIPPFLADLQAEGICPENVRTAILLLQEHGEQIRIQLAAMVDVGKPLCEGKH